MTTSVAAGDETFVSVSYYKFISFTPFTNMDKLKTQYGYVITYILKCGMKLLIYS